jgi:hypothetical protein
MLRKQVGERLADYHTRLRTALEIPPQVLLWSRPHIHPAEPRLMFAVLLCCLGLKLRAAAARVCPRLQSGFYHLLPSFFRLINTLEASPPRRSIPPIGTMRM